MNKLTVLLLFGGESPEHDVSIRSAANVYQAINSDKYHVELCYIDKQGNWQYAPKWQDDGWTEFSGMALAASFANRGFISSDGSIEIRPDVILPVLHGDNGEDGAVQGLAKLLHVPIVGCGISASAVCWDKVLTKQLLAADNIPIVPYRVHQTGEAEPDYDAVVSSLGETLFVKPATSGSSIGVSKVTNGKEFTLALESAGKYSKKVLIEQAIVGRELEVGVLGNPPEHRVSGVGEIRPGQDFYSYEDKYDAASVAEVIVDADLSEDKRQQLQQIAYQAYAVLGCSGLARIDFLLDDSGQAYINEVNTFPGFTSISQYPKLWQAAGVGYADLVDSLIDSALLDV